MEKTLHELGLKFLVKNKIDGYVVAAFNSATEAIYYLKIRNKQVKEDMYELKESF